MHSEFTTVVLHFQSLDYIVLRNHFFLSDQLSSGSFSLPRAGLASMDGLNRRRGHHHRHRHRHPRQTSRSSSRASHSASSSPLLQLLPPLMPSYRGRQLPDCNTVRASFFNSIKGRQREDRMEEQDAAGTVATTTHLAGVHLNLSVVLLGRTRRPR